MRLGKYIFKREESMRSGLPVKIEYRGKSYRRSGGQGEEKEEEEGTLFEEKRGGGERG